MHALVAVAILLVAAPATAQRTNYKRVHQNALRLVIDGKTERAITALEELLANDAEDPETWFASSAAHAAAGAIDRAIDCASRAIELGLPPERFTAPPRAWFAPLADDDRFRALLAPASPLVHGPTVGALAHDRVRIWVRTADHTTVSVIATTDGREPIEADSRTGFDDTANVELAGLTPDTAYSYDVTIDDTKVAAGTFHTAPPPGTPSRFSIVFGGGAGFVPPHERVWNTIAARSPKALLLLGDNVYIDDPERRAMQRYTYSRRQSRPEWRTLTAQVPVHAIWDDHDFGTNDCIGGATRDRPRWKPAVSEIFRANWPDPDYGTSDLGCWHRLTIGDVDFFLLDGRSWRTDPKDNAPTMLGPVQLEWLRTALAASTATFKVIASPVPWNYHSKGDSLDTWNGFRAEREALFAFLTRERIAGVLLLSADRHRSDAWKIERTDSYPLYEFNSSRLTNQHLHPEMEAALFSYHDTQSFGEVTFDTTVDDPTVRYDVVTIDGEVVHSLELRRSTLQ